MKSKKARSSRSQSTARDFRRFLFRSTGDLTSVSKFGVLDAIDNGITETDRLRCLSRLLLMVNDELDRDVVEGLGLLMGDVESRIRQILELLEASKSRAA